MQAPSPLSEASHWKGDQFALIIVSQGSEEGFLQLRLYFLEARVGVLIPGKAVLLFEEGLEGLSVQAEMRGKCLQVIYCTEERL